jgi:hypothetical protein
LKDVDERNPMRRLLVLATAGTLAALAATGTASAKGPSAASLTGPGLDHAVRIAGYGEGGTGTPLGALVQYGGFFPQVFGGSPDPATRTRPPGDLGPRYRVVYRVPGGQPRASVIVQDVYPYAKPRPVTYMRAGQRFWGSMHTKGGWVVSEAGMKAALVKAGLPTAPPAAPTGRSSPWVWTGAVAVAAFLLLLLALGRRRITRLRTLRSSTA